MNGNVFGYLTREDFEIIDPKTVVIIPVGAIEQHGPHLPVATDTLILDKFLSELHAVCSKPFLLIPTLSYGYSPHHFCYRGVLSLSSTTLLSILSDIGNSLVKSGFKKLLFITGHGGNEQLLGQSARDLCCSYPDLMCASASYWQIAEKRLFDFMKSFTKWIPGHAGLFETSVISAINEDLIDTSKFSYIENYDVDSDKILFSDLRQKSFIERSNYHAQIHGMTDYELKHVSPKLGNSIIKIVSEELAKFIEDFYLHE